MDKLSSFRKTLEALSNCGYCSDKPARPYVSLDRDHYQCSAYLPEESFSSRFACTQAAENKLHEYYVEAYTQFAAYSDPLSADGFLTRFKEHLVSLLAELKEQLEICRTPDRAADIDAVLNCLVPDEVIRCSEQIHETLRKRYVLPPEDTYKHQIAYEKYDPAAYESSPAAKLIAKLFVRYGFDLLEAIHRLEFDAARILLQYKNAFDAQMVLEIERSIIRPALSGLKNSDSKAQ